MDKVITPPDSSFAKTCHAIAYLRKGNKVYDTYTGTMCYSVVTYTDVPLLDIRTYFPSDWFWPEHYIQQILDHPVFGKVILTKDIEEARKTGFQFDVDAPSQIVVAAMQTIRCPFEFTCTKTIDALSRNGATVYECIAFSLILRDECPYSSIRNTNHTPFGHRHDLKEIHTHEWVNNAAMLKFSEDGGIRRNSVSGMFPRVQDEKNDEWAEGKLTTNLRCKLKEMCNLEADTKLETDIFGNVVRNQKMEIIEDRIQPALIKLRKELGYEV